MSDSIGPERDGPDEQRPDAVRAAAEHGPFPTVPADVSKRLRDAFHASLPTLPADLDSDTRDERPLVGVRGRSATAWTMTYRAGTTDVVIDLVPQPRRIRVSGQVLGPDTSPGALVRVFCADELVTAASTDEFGQFDVGELPAQVYTVTAAGTSHLIELVVDLRDGAVP